MRSLPSLRSRCGLGWGKVEGTKGLEGVGTGIDKYNEKRWHLKNKFQKNGGYYSWVAENHDEFT